MKYFTNLFTGSLAKGLQQRPLLCVVGAAATAVGVYYYIKRERNEEERAIPAQFNKAVESIKEFTVKERVRKLGDLLLESYAECEEKNKECVREREAKSVLQSQNDEMKEILSELKNTLNFNPAENVEKYKQMMEFNTELQKEHSELIYNMQNLSDTLEKMEEKVHVADKMCEGMRQDYETECQIHCILKVQYNELKGQNNELLKYDQINNASDTEKSLMEFLTMSKRYEQMMEINAQMEKEQLDYVQELSGTVEQLEEKINEAERTCEKIKQECESEQKAYSALQSRFEETLKLHFGIPTYHITRGDEAPTVE